MNTIDNDTGNDSLENDSTDDSGQDGADFDASVEEQQASSEEVPPQPADVSPQEPKLMHIPTASMKRIKEGERQRGRENAITELNIKAKALGFRSHEDLLASAQRFRERSKPQGQQSSTPDPEHRESPRKVSALEKDVARLTDERKRQNRRIADLEKENKKLRAQLDSQETESTLRVAAARHGVKDVDYALHVCRAHCSRLSQEQLGSFNEDKFFGETLKASHSYLYGAEERLANTTPVAPTPGKPAAPVAAPVQDPAMVGVDATKLSPEEYKQLLKARGLSDPLVNAYAG